MTTIETIRSALRISHTWTHGLAEDMRDAAMTAPTPRGGNHPMWVMGHAAYSKGALLMMISGTPNPVEHWKEWFEGGSEPKAEADVYPTYDEVLSACDRLHQQALDLLDETGEAGLDQAPAMVWPELTDDPDFQTKGQLFLFTAMHEMSHRGQLADARRAAGRSRLFF